MKSLATVALALALATPFLPLPAQSGLEAHAGTFLTRDRGWNWELNLLGRVGFATEWSTTWRGVAHVTGRVSACPCGHAPVIPAPPGSVENGVGLGYDLQARHLDKRFTTLVGIEWFTAFGEERDRGSTVAGSTGVGWNWGQRRRWGTELRYGVFARRLGTTRGRLEWAIVRR